MDLANGRRPVLHKYRPEDLEIVYHRQTGDEIVSKNSLKKHAQKANGSVKQRTTTGVSLSTPVFQFPITHTFKSEKRKITEESQIHSRPARSHVLSSETEKSVNDLLVNAISFDHNQGSMLPDLEPPEEGLHLLPRLPGAKVQENELCCENEKLLSTCMEKLDSLAEVVIGLNKTSSALENRIKILEGASQKLIAHNLFLLEKYSNNAKFNYSVANDMIRLRNVLTGTGDATMKEAAEVLKTQKKLCNQP